MYRYKKKKKDINVRGIVPLNDAEVYFRLRVAGWRCLCCTEGKLSIPLNISQYYNTNTMHQIEGNE